MNTLRKSGVLKTRCSNCGGKIEWQICADESRNNVGSQKIQCANCYKDAWDELMEECRNLPVSDEDREKQRRSFAFGNANISNPLVTKELVDKVADEMAKYKLKNRRK